MEDFFLKKKPLHFKTKIESCSFQSDATSLSVCRSFQTLCVLLSCSRLFVWELFLFGAVCLQKLVDACVSLCNC